MGFRERLFSALISRGRTQPLEEFTFENLAQADRVVVTTNLNETIKVVDDLQTLQAILDFVKRHKSGWAIPVNGVPVTRLRLNFYTTDTPLGNFGVDETFLTTHQSGGFWSKASNAAEGSQLLDILGLKSYDNE